MHVGFPFYHVYNSRYAPMLLKPCDFVFYTIDLQVPLLPSENFKSFPILI